MTVDRTGSMLLTAQYGGGSVAAFSLRTDGALQARTALIKHDGGAKVVPGRQDSSHAHWVGFSPDRWLVAAGQDTHSLASFAVNPGTGQLTYNRSVIYAPSPICVPATVGTTMCS